MPRDWMSDSKKTFGNKSGGGTSQQPAERNGENAGMGGKDGGMTNPTTYGAKSGGGRGNKVMRGASRTRVSATVTRAKDRQDRKK